MILDNIYKNTVSFTTSDNAEFRFTDNKSETRYLLDIIIDNNITINNVFSIGTFKNIGTIINNSNNTIGIKLENTKVTLVLTGSHVIDIKIKQGIFTGVSNSVSTPISPYTIPKGYSFGGDAQQMMTATDKLAYLSNMIIMENEMLRSTNQASPLLIGVNSLLDPSEVLATAADLYNPYSHNNTTYPKFAYTSKLVSDATTETAKNKQISNLISDTTIPNALFIDANIKKAKLGATVQASINLANSALQNIYINSKVAQETKTNGAINLNLSDLVKTMKKDNLTRYDYATDVSGIGTIDYDSIDIQSKILNANNDEKAYFISYLTGDEYGFEDMDQFFKKENNIKLGQNTVVSDDLLYSSAQTKALLSNKVDTLVSPLTLIDDKFIKFTINTQGQVIDSSLVARSDLSNLLDSHYKRSNISKVINTNRSTIFFI